MTRTVLLAATLCAAALSPLQGQGPDAGHGIRFGVSLGGISTVALNVEPFWDSRGVEISLGTWSFRDASLSVVGKQYLGAGSAKPVIGAGLWIVGSAPDEGRTGWALVLRAPVGVDWSAADHHALGAFLNVNMGLWVRRSDPSDDLPLNRRLVPLPEIYYRYTR